MGHHQAAALDCDLKLVILEEGLFSFQLLDLTTNFPLAPSLRTRLRSSVLRMSAASVPCPWSPEPKLPKRLKWRNRLVGVAPSQTPVHRHLSVLRRYHLLVWSVSEEGPVSSGGNAVTTASALNRDNRGAP